MTQPNTIDLDLIDQIVAHIPDWTWDAVCQRLVPALVDNMPGSVIGKLTGQYDNFDRAEEILFDYYTPLERKNDLIVVTGIQDLKHKNKAEIKPADTFQTT